MKGLVAAVALCVGALAGCGGSGNACNTACNKVYDQCRLTLQGQSGPIDKAGCISLCNSQQPAERDRVTACIQRATCDEQTILACIQ